VAKADLERLMSQNVTAIGTGSRRCFVRPAATIKMDAMTMARLLACPRQSTTRALDMIACASHWGSSMATYSPPYVTAKAKNTASA